MWRRTLATAPGIALSLLPKLVCPLCWPAYAGVISTLGLGFLIIDKYSLILTIVFLVIAAASLGSRARGRRGYGPLWTGLFAAAVILIGKFYFDTPQSTYAGVLLLFAASVWNSWPCRALDHRCRDCEAAAPEADQTVTHGERI